MEKLKRINSSIARKQVIRLIGGVGMLVCGLWMLADYKYQKGITDCQKAICREFPEEYSAIGEKLIKAFEEN